jgi:MerR family copper efflux transcriptional regulator
MKMNISQLAKATSVTTDTLRYYEKQGLISAPPRQENGYRAYTEVHIELVRFVRGAQTLGFSLTEIRAVLAQVSAGTFGRAEIEQHLRAKMEQIDAHMRQLKTLKKELIATFAMLTCKPDKLVSAADRTAINFETGVGTDFVKQAFSTSLKK